MTQIHTDQPSTVIRQITDTFDANATTKIEDAYVTHTRAFGVHTDLIRVRPATNTLDIGVAVSEEINNSQRPDRLILAVNCAPAEKDEGTHDNARNDFFFAELVDGVFVGGTSNALELAYVRENIHKLYRLTTTNALGSQFRSLEVLPKHLVQFVSPEQRKKLIADGALVEINHVDDIVAHIPNITHVIEVDNFKNAKLFLSDTDRTRLELTPSARFAFSRHSVEKAPGQKAPWRHPHKAIVAPKLFDAGLGRNIVARNSSSKVFGSTPVPMIATIRKNPAETLPNYGVPAVGQRAFLRLVA